MWQYSECFHGNNKKEVKPHACFTVYETRNPYQVLAVCKYVIVTTTIGNTSLKWLKRLFVIYLVTPPTFNVYNCYQIKHNLLILFKSYW